MQGVSLAMHSARMFITKSVFWPSVAVAVCFVVTFVGVSYRSSPTPEKGLKAAQRELEAGRTLLALEQAKLVLAQFPRHVPAMMLTAQTYEQLGQLDQSTRLLEGIPQDGSEIAFLALQKLSERDYRSGNWSAAEKRWSAMLGSTVYQPWAHLRLAMLYAMSAQKELAQSHLLWLLERGRSELKELAILAAPGRQLMIPDEVTRSADPFLNLAEAQRLVTKTQYGEAEKLLRSSLTARTDLLDAQASLGEILLEQGNAEQLVLWRAELPPTADRSPRIWFIKGLIARRLNQPDEEIRCLCRSLCKDTTDGRVCFQLGSVIKQHASCDNDKQVARRLLEYAARLEVLDRCMVAVFQRPNDLARIRAAADQLISLGRLWEGRGWLTLLKASPEYGQDARRLIANLEPQLSAMPGQLAHPDEHPLRDFDEVQFVSQIKSASATPSAGNEKELESGNTGLVRFGELPAVFDPPFQYWASPDDTTPGSRMFEFTGGGVGAIDFDRDGWCDLFLTQGTDWPTDSRNQHYWDRLYRNIEGRASTDVTRQTGIIEASFSQGVAIGDYDNDGFADVYVANIGRNRLFRNRGDGTFDDVSEKCPLAPDAWTTSVLLADVNADSYPDLYDVNYLQGEGVDSRICDADGSPAACSPLAFESAPDCLLISTADGRFFNASKTSGIDVANGNGLGIVAADLHGEGRPSLFVANDLTANFDFEPLPEVGDQLSGPERPLFQEAAISTGLAYDADGKAQACMGLAAADFDGDLLLDFFVTNFYQESNTLYRQISGNGFADETRRFGLREPSLSLLGFGTQGLDANLDSWPDIVIVNGHVDDLRHKGIPYSMRPQFLLNQSGRSFRELTAEEAGEWFKNERLGRGLAALDWNKDGLPDFCVSHLDTPASLLLNESTTSNHFLAIVPVGTVSSRDGFFVTATCRFGGQTRMHQLVAGGGYQSSNERQLLFGLGKESTVQELRLVWPSGTVDTFDDVPADRQFIAIEGSRQLYQVR
jgi:thioredoxin-like negative regulator of GroEL